MIISAPNKNQKMFLIPHKEKIFIQALSSENVCKRLQEKGGIQALLKTVPQNICNSQPTFTVYKIPKGESSKLCTQVEIINYTGKKILLNEYLKPTIDGNYLLSNYAWGLFLEFDPIDRQCVFFKKDGKYFLVNKTIPKFPSDKTKVQILEIEGTKVGYIFHDPEIDEQFSERGYPIFKIKKLEEDILKVIANIQQFLTKIVSRNIKFSCNTPTVLSVCPYEFENEQLSCEPVSDEILSHKIKGFIVKFSCSDEVFDLHTNHAGDHFYSPNFDLT